jgi:HK97 family phage prohead protease
MEIMEIKFSAPIYATDAATRELSGLIVPFGSVGQTSAGAVQFEAGALSIPETGVKLLLEHDLTRPLGKLIPGSLEVTPVGIKARFKIAETTSGNDVLVEAATGLRDGFSVGVSVNDYEYQDNVMHVKASSLQEVSVVTNPAFSEARITDVAASADTATEPITDKVEEVDNIQSPAEAEVVAEITEPVQASAQTAPVYAAKRKPSADELTLAVVRAARGDQNAMQTITAALDGATTISSPGNIPVAYMQDVISIIDAERPFLNSISRGALPAAGTNFKKPRWTSYPTVDVHEEGDIIASNPALIESIDVTIKPRMGGNKVSVELIDRSAPEYLSELRRALADAYAINTSTAAIDTFVSHTYTATGTGYAAIVDGIQKVYTGIKRRPNRLLLSADSWADAMTLTDEAGRPLFSPVNPTNAAGVMDAFSGQILGLQIVVDHNAPAGTAIVYSDRAATYYEAAGSPASLSALLVSTAEVEVAVKGYDAFCEDFLLEVSEGVFRNPGAYAVNF